MSNPVMHWKDASAFRFVRHSYDPGCGEARLVYAFDNGPELVETITFPDAPWPGEPGRQTAFRRLLGWLHAAAGVSYYKASVPRTIDTEGAPMNEAVADLMQRLYVGGLAEFAYRNQVELEDRVHFDDCGAVHGGARELGLANRALVAMGGGKDSLVSLEVLREAGFDLRPACVGGAPLIRTTAEAAGLPLLCIQRRLAPGLKEMNAAGALNGHVPVTAINSLILLCAAVLYGDRYVVFSNERSADEATLTDVLGRPVNHQYSKGLDFERRLRALVHDQVAPDLEYFSLLRPLDEVTIAQRFTALERYHRVFSSCNRHFHLDGARIEGRWCGDCPKCRFTALVLAPWLPPAELKDIMGRVPLDEVDQADGYRALCGLGVDKPFECVGTREESRAALVALRNREGWQDCAVVHALADEAAASGGARLEALLKRRGPHCIPADVLAHVDF